MCVSSDRSIELADTFGGVDHQQRDVGTFEVLACHHDRKLFCHQMCLAFAANAGRIDEAETASVVLDNFVYGVPSGARHG